MIIWKTSSPERDALLMWDWRRFGFGFELYVGESFTTFLLRLAFLMFDLNLWGPVDKPWRGADDDESI